MSFRIILFIILAIIELNGAARTYNHYEIIIHLRAYIHMQAYNQTIAIATQHIHKHMLLIFSYILLKPSLSVATSTTASAWRSSSLRSLSSALTLELWRRPRTRSAPPGVTSTSWERQRCVGWHLGVQIEGTRIHPVKTKIAIMFQDLISRATRLVVGSVLMQS